MIGPRMRTRAEELKIIAPCFLAILVDVCIFGLVYPLIAILFSETSGGFFSTDTPIATQNLFLSFCYLLGPLFMFFGTSIMSDYSDIKGRRKALTIALYWICVGFALMGLGAQFYNIWIFLLGRALSGFMSAGQPIAIAATADISSEETKAHNISTLLAAGALGIVVGPAIGGFFADNKIVSFFTPSLPFYILAALSIVAALWVKKSLQDIGTLNKNKKLSIFRPIEIFFEALRDKRIRVLVPLIVLFQVGFGLFFQTISYILAHDFHFSSGVVGLYNVIMGVFFAIGSLWLIPMLLKRTSVVSICVIGLLLNAIGITACGLFPNLSLFWMATVILGIGNIFAYVEFSTLFSNAANKENQGWAMGIFMAGVALAFAICGASANLLTVMSPYTLLIIAGICNLIPALGLWFIYRPLDAKLLKP